MNFLIFLFTMILSAFPSLSQLAMPEQVHLSLSNEPDAMTVTWVTMNPLNNATPMVEYGYTEANLQFHANAETNNFVYNGVHRYIHSVTLQRLSFNTTYYYQVGSTLGWSHIFHFRTFPQGNNFSYKVAIIGDLGNINGVSMPFLQKAAANGDFDLVIHVGDIAYDLHTENGIGGDNFTNAMGPIIAYVPYMVIAGNHEDDGQNFSNYKNRFVMPSNGYGDNQFYSFDLGPIHFVGVSTEYYGFFNEYGHVPVINQYNWLVNDLKIKTGFEDLPGLENLYIQNGMDLGFWGHEHSYERFWPASGRQVYNQTSDPYHNAAAPIYLTGCHSGHALFENPPSPASVKRFNDYGYTMLNIVNRTHLFIEQISVEAGNQVIDQVWVSKDPNHVAKPAFARTQKFVKFPDPKICNSRDAQCRAKHSHKPGNPFS